MSYIKKFCDQLIDLIIKLFRGCFRDTKIQHWQLTEKLYLIIMGVRTNSRRNRDYLVDFRGGKFFFESGDITILPTLISGEYEKTEISRLLDFVNMKEKNFKLIDVGANVGIYSVIFAKEVQKISMAELLPNGPDHKNRADKEVSKKKGGAVVFAFEPDPRNLSRFYRNIALNIDRPELIFVSEFGISDEKKRSKFNLSKFGGTSGIESYGKEPNFEIEVDTLDRFCTGLISPQENLILKVDVEGHESAVLRGALNTLKANRPIVFIEVFPQSSNLDFDLMDEILLLYTHAEYVSGSKTQCFKDLNSNQLRSFKKYGNLILYNK